MRRHLPLLGAVAALVLTAAIPASASARSIRLGLVASRITPSCPQPSCLAISRTTGYQAKSGEVRKQFTVPANGRLVAWGIKLGNPDAKQRQYFHDTLGGAAAAQIAVLRPVRRGKVDGKRRKFRDHLHYRVRALGPLTTLWRYFGRYVQIPLTTTLPVRKGDVIGLTVPTWAPALAVGLSSDYSWRASRGRHQCDDTQVQTAQVKRLSLDRYWCLYQTARLTYSALIVTTPLPNKPAKKHKGAAKKKAKKKAAQKKQRQRSARRLRLSSR